ncbi:Hep_Hag family protein [Serratia marcescens VGH107]|nr:Hep_Hag family protein [Serratia marcescens VGH107]
MWAAQSGIKEVARKAYSGVAAATALTMIPEVDPGKTFAIGVGGGTYQGYSASALGVSARVTDSVKVKLGAGFSGTTQTYGIGASYQW